MVKGTNKIWHYDHLIGADRAGFFFVYIHTWFLVKIMIFFKIESLYSQFSYFSISVSILSQLERNKNSNKMFSSLI